MEPALTRRGAALPLALLALIFTLGTAALLLEGARIRLESGRRQLAGRLAQAAALGAVAERVAQWDSSLMAGLSPGGVLELGSRTWSGSLNGADSVIRLSADLGFVFSATVVRGGGAGVLARRGVGLVTGLTPAGGAKPVPGGWWIWGR